jgi:hypothetical protein
VAVSGYSGCSGFCPNFLTGQKGHVAVSGCSGCSGFCPNFFKGQSSEARGSVLQCSGCLGCSGIYANFLTGQKVARDNSMMLRLFRLLPKLSHGAKNGTWQFQDVQDVQGVQTFAQNLMGQN